MRVKKKYKTGVILELENWEAKNLVKLLNRIKTQDNVSKSQFSMTEKVVGRHIVSELDPIVNKKEPDKKLNGKLDSKNGFQERPLSPLEIDILERIRLGETSIPKTFSNYSEITNALTLLRRRGITVNTGTRTQPIWKLKEK